jgi:diacylglycerol kinase family enzyme
MLVTNPAAGERHAKSGDLERCEEILRTAGLVLDRVATGAESPTSADLARRAIEQGYDACIVAGGDGTVAPAAAALLDSSVILGILPFGSVMNIANGLGIPLEPVKAAEVIAQRRVIHADAGQVREKIFFETARLAERGDWRRALRRVWRWLTHKSFRVAINVDGREDRQRALQIFVMNDPYYGWSLELLERVSMTDGLLDVAIFPRVGRWALLVSLIAVWRGRKLPVRPLAYRGAHITITSSDPVAVHADGEFAGGLPAEFTCRKGALSVFA